MLLNRLSLRNYRVYEQPLDLELPPGLIGIYGPNGSGKSTLLEAILFALWGRARTSKEDVRTAGVGGDCVAELTFEHEGHLYLVRRSLSGINLTARAEVHCDGLAMAEGVRDAGRYLHQVLGMDDAAFRASVFAEQKQLAAFSDRSPSERRQLVLQLLGITPLDGARDAARKDARDLHQSHERLRAMLPDLEELRVQAADAVAAAEAASVVAEAEEAAAAAARARVTDAEEAFRRVDRVRQEHEALVIEGRAARSHMDAAVAQVGVLETEGAQLEEAAAQLEALLPRSAGVDEAAARLARVSAVVAGEKAVAAVVVPPEPAKPDEAGLDEAERGLQAARAAAGAWTGQVEAVTAELARAQAQLARSADLSGAADCPLCGQALGAAFEKVQSHRAAEVREAEDRLAQLAASQREAERAVSASRAVLEAKRQEDDRRRQARKLWDEARVRRATATDALASARSALGDLSTAPWLAELVARVAESVSDRLRHVPSPGPAGSGALDRSGRGAGGRTGAGGSMTLDRDRNQQAEWLGGAGLDEELVAALRALQARVASGADPSPPLCVAEDVAAASDGRATEDNSDDNEGWSLAPLELALRLDVEDRRSAAAAVQRLQGRLERRATMAEQLEGARERAAEYQHQVTVLRDKVRSLGFDAGALAAASEALTQAEAADQQAARTARDLRLAAERTAARADGEAKRLADGEAQHAALAAMADESRHLGRMAELLNAFRNSVVASVGPRLAVQAADLFAELTDREYDQLEVDPETYELQIRDGGRLFGLDRFSGSEVDLANLALRVAISEHVRFQSGGTVGLLVLDEVFGPLDEDRKARMLQALERLRGRFRQVLVVTHDADIKEQLPHAIEVHKQPGRRASARLVDS